MMHPKGTFTSNLWQSIDGIYQQITHSIFFVQLANGKLSKTAFAHYLSQDILYLHKDYEALEILSDKAPDTTSATLLQTLADDAIGNEKILHDEYLGFYNVPEAKELSPAFKAYCDFLLYQVHHSSFETAAAALLPCFWIYSCSGQLLLEKQTPDNPYQKFILTYAEGTYTILTEQFIEMVEDIGKGVSLPEQKMMTDAFIQSAQFELSIFEESGTG
ncbi:MAG: TenA family protein [Bacteroidales bacterium]|jgi:thiaminase/transcriptional activator TenA|nr:TenA family protein [Bacteroidales bacterium]